MTPRKIAVPSLAMLAIAGSFALGQKIAGPAPEVRALSVRFLGETSAVAVRQKGERDRDVVVDKLGHVRVGSLLIATDPAAALAKDVATCRTSVEHDIAALVPSLPSVQK